VEKRPGLVIISLSPAPVRTRFRGTAAVRSAIIRLHGGARFDMKIVLQSILNRKKFVYHYRGFIAGLFAEDRAGNDLTTRYTAHQDGTVTARIIAKESGVLAGMAVLRDVFHFRDSSVGVSLLYQDGAAVAEKDVICELSGRTTSILQSERIALNILQRMSGVATETARLVELVKGTPCRLLNTRKTIPGMRYLEKYATTVGGALNHRLNLSDGILIKENHIMAAGSIRKAVSQAWERKPGHILIEVEVRDLTELEEAVDLPVDLVMLDNFDLETVRKAVALNKGRKKLEVSGNVTAKNIRAIAETGVDYISVGAITHSAHSLDFSLLIYDSIYD
jgi:nicotinate-nucleotide pyrophosphorylase (carboxylating)